MGRPGGATVTQATLALHAPQETSDDGATPLPRGRRRWRFVSTLLILLGCAAWFCPTIAARSGLRHRFVQWVVPAYPGAASVGSASLAWTRPIVLYDVTLCDLEGQELLRVAELRTSKTLAALAFGASDDLGVLTLTRPEAMLRLRPGGSNLEEILRPTFEATGSSSGLTVKIDEGQIGWTTIGGAASPGGLALSATVVWPPAASLPSRVDCAGTLSDGEHASEFSIRLRSTGTAEASRPSEITVIATDLPLTPLQPWLDRFETPFVVSGSLSTDLVATPPANDSLHWHINGRIDGRRLRITNRDWPNDRQVLLESVSLSGGVSGNAEVLTLDDVQLQSDVGTLNSSGTFRIKDIANAAGWPQVADAVLANDATVVGAVDLTKLVSALPNSVRLRRPIDSGSLSVALRTSGDDAVRRGVVRVETSDVVAGPVVWRRPLTMDLAVRRDAHGFSAEQIRAESDFLTLNGSASSTNADVRLEADLAKLRESLAQIIDLHLATLSGQVTGRIVATPIAGADRLRVEANGAMRGLNVVHRNLHWTERELTFVGTAEAQIDALRRVIVESGRLTIGSVEGDELILTVTAPVAFDADWPLSLTAKGEASRWLERASAWSLLPETRSWSADGRFDATATLRLGTERVEVRDSDIQLRDARLLVANRVFDVPHLRLNGNAVWHRNHNLLTVPDAELTSDTAVIAVEDFRIPLSHDSPPTGELRFRGGIGKLARFALPARPPVWLSGVVSGTIDLQADAGTLVATTELEFERPVLTRAVTAGQAVEWRPVWSDDRVTASAMTRYSTAGERFDVQALTISATGLSIDASGRLDRLTSVPGAELSGKLNYDLELLCSRFSTGFADGITASGKGQRPFVVHGPLRSDGGTGPGLVARTGIDWDRFELLGLAVGPGAVSGVVDRQTLRVEPFVWPVNGGHIRGEAAVSLANVPTLSIAKGRVVDRVNLTPEITRRWVRYAAPALADVTAVEGTFSLDIAACAVPLGNASGAEAEAALVIDELEATQGPFARALINVVGQVQAVVGGDPTNGSDLRLVAPSQRVGLRIAGGRVFHDRFSVRLGDENGRLVSTSGSVGFDESLDLVVEVPLDAKWFKDERLAATLGGQTLRVPVRGMLSRPAPDPQALQDLARRAAAGAVNGLLDRQIEKQVADPLRKLFDRGK